MSAYKIAMDAAAQTIQQRAKYYRNLIAVVTFTIIGSIVWAIIAGAFWPLVGLILLFPICGFFFLFDDILLNHWRSQLFQQWVSREIEFRYFLDAIRAMVMLPKNTIEGMLNFLPKADDVLKGQRLTIETRQAISMLIRTLDFCRSCHLALKAIAYALAAILLIVSIHYGVWQLMLGLLSLPILLGATKWIKRRRIKMAQRSFNAIRKKTEFDHYAYFEYASAQDWGSVSEKEKQMLMAKEDLSATSPRFEGEPP